MPPKKQPQIDLSTLPECKTINILLSCLGKKERATKLIDKINTEGQKYISHVKKAQILDHAKEKGIYVDPQSLTDKQKKDPKFMETVCTELTPQVFAKSVDSYLTAQTVKVRVEKKAQLEKPQEQRIQTNRKFDYVYVLDDFPTESAQFSALADAKQNVDFVLAFAPKVSWANAPELPEEEPDNEEPQDEEVVEYKKLLEKQKITEEDEEHENKIYKQIEFVKESRKKSPIESLFRNTAIEQISLTIDPYNEETSINQITNKFVEKCNSLISDYTEFLSWKKQKQTKKIIESQPPKEASQQKKQQNAENMEEKEEPKEEKKRKAKGSNHLQILLNFIKEVQEDSEVQKENQENINFDDFNFDGSEGDQHQMRENATQRDDYIEHSEWKDKLQQVQYQDLLHFLKFPGINRFQMPENPQKSKDLRKVYRSSLGQFLPEGVEFHEFERKLDILKFEEVLKEVDEERTYDLSNRIYEEEHNTLSLTRTLYQALLFDESLMGVKYNENNDKLYFSLVYKNNARHSNPRQWQCSWKVLPNFENWLKYFKENETNFSNTHFYDIDCQKIGNIEDKTVVYSTKNNGIIVSKFTKVANQTNNLLYCILDNLIFGLKANSFYSQNDKVKILHRKNEDQTFSTFITFKNQTIVELKSTGDIIIRKPDEDTRLITPEGYTIIYKKNQPTVFHPNGGISYPPSSFINKNGKGLKNGQLQEVSSLKRKKDGNDIVKRDDGTVIVEDEQKCKKKWVKFPEGTEYLQEKDSILIEKENLPFVRYGKDEGCLEYCGMRISIKRIEDKYCFKVQLDNDTFVELNQELATVTDENSCFECSLKDQYIFKAWENEQLKVFFSGKSELKRNGKMFNPLEDEQNFGESDVLPQDHLEPRLFLINNDNTGKELLSQKQLQKVLAEKEKCQSKMKYNKRKENQEVVHLVNIEPTKKEVEQRLLRPDISINLDILKKSEDEKVEENYHTISLRSVTKYLPLTTRDREMITQVMEKNGEWKKKIQKDENQYGHKQKNDPLTSERYESKRSLIKYRQNPQKEINTEVLRKEVIQLHEQEKERRMIELDRLRKQEQLQRDRNKKKVYQANYIWKDPPYRESDENEKYYNSEEDFYATYFGTVEGKKALNQMPDWVFRPKQKKEKQELDQQIISELNATNNLNQTRKDVKDQQKSVEEDRNERYDTVEVNIQPKQQIFIKPSVFTQRQINDQRDAFESEKKAYQYHEMKRKEFDLYGQERKQKMEVPSLMRTQPASELNQKYLVTEAPVDKKVKISSMKDRLTNLASNMTEMRKEGPHNNLIRTMDKRYDYGNLLEKRTMMVQADLNDKLQRDILINPIEANFGTVKEGSSYELKIQIKNEDVLSQRIILKKPKSIFCHVQMNSMGPIALGMTRKVIVNLKASPEIIGKFEDEFDIVTKHEIYHIPIQAHIITKSQFESGRAFLSKNIKQTPQLPKKSKETLPPIK